MKICFVAQHIYPYLSDFHEPETAGGAELQQLFIGRELKELGYDVSYIALDYGQSDGQNLNGLKVFKTFKPDEGLFGIRFFYPRLFKIWRALKRADADIYYVRCATFIVGIVAIFCNIYKKKCIYAGAHVTDFLPKEFRIPTKRDKILYTYGLHKVNKIIVQSNQQKRLLWLNFKLKSSVIRNFSPGLPKTLTNKQKHYILWVGTIRKWKRPEYYLELAKKYPDESFIMIGGRSFGEEMLYEKIEMRTQKINNLTFLGFQPYEITEKYFDQCKVYVNTSEYEGFPNTFLQAWRRGMPVLSFFDPDNIVKNYKLGLVVKSSSDLKDSLSKLLNNLPEDSEHIVEYFTTHHSKNVVKQYVAEFKSLQKLN